MSYTPEEMQYWSLLSSSQENVYPEFIQHLRYQEDSLREEGKAVLIEFQDGARPSIHPAGRPFASSRALRRCLNEKLRPEQTNPGGHRWIILLEGLPRNYVQVIGANLHIPPEFFASHWATLSFMGNLVNRTPRHYNNRNRFTLEFPKLHQAMVAALPGDDNHPFYRMDSSTQRHLSRTTIFGDTDGPLTGYEQLSFWSASDGENWTGVLLVEPPLGEFVWWRDSPIPRQVHPVDCIEATGAGKVSLNQRGSWYLPVVRSEKLLLSSSSTFSIILDTYRSSERKSTSDPNSCVDICRKLALSAWTARIRVAEAQLVNEQLRLSIGDLPDDVRSADIFDRSWARPWHPRDFARLVRAKSALESIDWELRRNMDALGIGSESGRTTEAWEADAWHGLRDVIGNLKTRLDIILQAYMQSISVREMSAANKQARQVGYLTSLATIFIPLSFVAAVFSMGGEFSAGSSRFWVYWVVATPVPAVGCLLFFTEFGRRIVQGVSEANSPV